MLSQSQHVQWKFFLEWQNGRKNKNPAIKPCAFKTDRSKVQHLDTDIANMTAESLNFWLIKFVPLILWKSKFTVTCDWLVETVETTLIMHLPFVSIAVITVEPEDKISFVYNRMQTRLRGQYNGKWPISLVCVSKPLVTVITAIAYWELITIHKSRAVSISDKTPHINKDEI